MARTSNDNLFREIHDFLLRDFTPHYGQLKDAACSNPVWARAANLGSELWLDTGNLNEIGGLWAQQLSAVTTNNTLLNKEVQSGQYDLFILQADEILRNYPRLTPQQRKLELAFMLNAHHALRLVEKFDCFVSVEEHTDLAFDVQLAVETARRYHALCPQRFYVKIPFTPAGLLATRIISREGIAVNHTLGFSARQNYVAARVARPQFVNVFLGRLNSFVAENKLGEGTYVGEMATVASQEALRELRRTNGVPTRQIAASFRDARQVLNLVGVDVLTMPAKVAQGFLDLKIPVDEIVDQSSHEYVPAIDPRVDAAEIRLDTLWDICDRLIQTVDDLEKQDPDSMTPADLTEFFTARGCGDFLVKWSPEQMAISAAEGKIPHLDNWRQLLAGKVIGLDSLMNLAGLNSFITDQRDMDEKVQSVLTEQVAHSRR